MLIKPLLSKAVQSLGIGDDRFTRGCIVDDEPPIIALVLNSFNHWAQILMDITVFASAIRPISFYYLKSFYDFLFSVQYEILNK
jgi:hypothetical protein